MQEDKLIQLCEDVAEIKAIVKSLPCHEHSADIDALKTDKAIRMSWKAAILILFNTAAVLFYSYFTTLMRKFH